MAARTYLREKDWKESSCGDDVLPTLEPENEQTLDAFSYLQNKTKGPRWDKQRREKGPTLGLAQIKEEKLEEDIRS